MELGNIMSKETRSMQVLIDPELVDSVNALATASRLDRNELVDGVLFNAMETLNEQDWKNIIKRANERRGISELPNITELREKIKARISQPNPIAQIKQKDNK